MIIERILGNVKDMEWMEKAMPECDIVSIHWYEVEKKVLYKTSKAGHEIGIRNTGTHLHDGDILWHEDNKMLILEIMECQCIAIKTETMVEMGKACYEIGNRHAPLFIYGEELLTPFDQPLIGVLQKCGLKVEEKKAKLVSPLGGHGYGHEHGHSHGHSH